MRIYLHYSEVVQDVESSDDLGYLVYDVLQAAVRWIESALRVDPVLGRLRITPHCMQKDTVSDTCWQIDRNFQACGDSTIPLEHFAEQEYCPNGRNCQMSPGGEGVPDADFVLYVRAHDNDICEFGGTLAYASTCYQDESDRPIAGSITFCKSAVLDHRDWDWDVSTAVHELLHTLGFSSTAFAWFRDDSGQPRTPRTGAWGQPPVVGGQYMSDPGTIKQETLRDGTLKHYVVLPRVLEAAQDHYGCPSLSKVPLEEQGGDGSAYSHWEAHYAYTEVMTPQVSSVTRVSRMTLALLEDSGWYKPDYSRAGPFRFGKGEGCAFFEERCVEGGETRFEGSFCTNTEDLYSCSSPYLGGSRGCSHDLMGVALCDTCRHGDKLPEKFQYFGNSKLGGSQSYASYCPIWSTFGSFPFCRDGPSPSNPYWEDYGESYGPASRCIMSTVTSSWALSTPEGACHDVQCSASSVWIRVGGAWVVCHESEEGQGKSADGWSGEVTCPSVAAICGDESDHGPGGGVPCQFPGVFRFGRCVCAAGYINEDCSVEDREASRSGYPFGLMYPQEELMLQVGTALYEAADLAAWPFKPSVVSGPADLRYDVSPPLPPGMRLNPDTGVLDGLPTAAVESAAYTFRASGGRGAATTTVFIGVVCAEGDDDCAEQAPATATVTTTTPEVCLDGWTPAKQCAPQFTYQGETYTGCTTTDYEGTGWCSHEEVYDGAWSSCKACGGGSLLGSATPCFSGWLPAPECVPQFEYLNESVAGCTIEGSTTGSGWCSHTQVADLEGGGWSFCQLCPEDATTTAESGPAESETSLLSISMPVPLSSIQDDPGIKMFLDLFADTITSSLKRQISQASLYALGTGQTVVEFCSPPSCVDIGGFAALDFAQNLANDGSALLQSEFGQRYLQAAALFVTTSDGVEQLWPEASDDSDGGGWGGGSDGYGSSGRGSAWWNLGGHLDSFVIAAAVVGLIAVVLYICVSMVMRYACGRKGGVAAARRRGSAESRTGLAAAAAAPGGGMQPAPAPQVFGQRQQPSAAAPPAPPPSKDEAMVQMLDMGFEFSAAKVALEACGWRIDQAVALIQGQHQQVQQSSPPHAR